MATRFMDRLTSHCSVKMRRIRPQHRAHSRRVVVIVSSISQATSSSSSNHKFFSGLKGFWNKTVVSRLFQRNAHVLRAQRNQKLTHRPIRSWLATIWQCGTHGIVLHRSRINTDNVHNFSYVNEWMDGSSHPLRWPIYGHLCVNWKKEFNVRSDANTKNFVSPFFRCKCIPSRKNQLLTTVSAWLFLFSLSLSLPFSSYLILFDIKKRHFAFSAPKNVFQWL